MSPFCTARNVGVGRLSGFYSKYYHNNTSKVTKENRHTNVRYLNNNIGENPKAVSGLRRDWGGYRDKFKTPTTPTFCCWGRDSVAPLNDCHKKNTIDEVPPLLMPPLFKLRAESNPSDVALSVFRDGEWHKTSYSEYYENTRIVAKEFIELGLEPFCSVNPIGFNSPEQYMAFQAAPMAGGFMAGIYPTNR